MKHVVKSYLSFLKYRTRKSFIKLLKKFDMAVFRLHVKLDAYDSKLNRKYEDIYNELFNEEFINEYGMSYDEWCIRHDSVLMDAIAEADAELVKECDLEW